MIFNLHVLRYNSAALEILHEVIQRIMHRPNYRFVKERKTLKRLSKVTSLLVYYLGQVKPSNITLFLLHASRLS